ncbi:pimeloyl-ACP methyl ester carboxylesterase [Microbacterium resistens]|uniref:Pimeloyl-ACP methyl ester carboxylesterase n=1 Tax=Microbacterium resistens TaxID=156977 RepID=A0ABU1SC74_9MICO|nr:alpha/beta fold hydrolase [Microbacterium resistens]MDR6867209.1 pimeloyl-ACP methyl ester carboxylesterase [Microbacterium resistens]
MPDSDALIEGISARLVDTPRRRIRILERDGDNRDAPADGTILFVHGDVSPVSFWQEMMHGLPSDLRVVAVDLRGAGGSPIPPANVGELAADVRALLDALGLEAAHLVGWSTGSAVAVQYALDHPVLSLTLQVPAADGIEASDLAEAAGTPPVLWIHGDGESAASSPMREAVAAYQRAGGDVTEVSVDGVDAVPHRERPAVFRQALLERIGYLGHPQNPAPPTEAIILRSAD